MTTPEALMSAAVETLQRCMDMLGDVPGATLEDRLTHYIGSYMALQAGRERSSADTAELDRRGGVMTFADLERSIVDYFETDGCYVEQEGLEWFLSLYDEGPAISLTALAVALSRPQRQGGDERSSAGTVHGVLSGLDEMIQRTVNPAPTKMSDRQVLDWVNGKARALHAALLDVPQTVRLSSSEPAPELADRWPLGCHSPN